MFDFITYFTDCVPDFIKKASFFRAFLLRNRFFHRCGSEAGGTASCGISVVGGTTAFFEDFPVETCFFSFLSSEESYTVKKRIFARSFPGCG